MKRFLAYFLYIVKHKWRVFIIGKHFKLSLYQRIFHDMSAFSPKEFFEYAHAMFTSDGRFSFEPNDAFDYAFLLHTKHNKHHWQYWVILDENNDPYPLEMDYEYVLEYVVDLLAIGRIPHRGISVYHFFLENTPRIIMHRNTYCFVRDMLEEYQYKGYPYAN